MKSSPGQLWTAIAVMLAACASAFAGNGLDEFYRGVRPMGMGNAFTAISDDQDAIFYNPAGLAYNRRLEVDLFNPKLEISRDDITTQSSLRQVGSAGIDSAAVSKLFGKNLYAGGTAFPSIYFPNFVVGYYYGAQGHVIARNLALPSVDMTYLLDRGFITGFGFEAKGFNRRQFLRFGLGFKWLTRTGFDGTIPIASLATVDKSFISTLKQGPATGYGGSLGLQYEFPLNRRDDVVLAAAWQDVGDTRFGGRISSGTPPPIRNNLAAGGALIHRFSNNVRSPNNVKVAAEMRHILQSNKDPRLKLHTGMELQIRGLGIQGGLNQDSLTAGVSLEIWFLKVAASTYGVENQSLAYMDRERRYVFQLTMKLDVIGQTGRTTREETRRKYPRDLK